MDSKAEATSGKTAAPVDDVHPLARTGKFCGGLRYDIRRRLPLYRSDWADGVSRENIQQVIASICFLFFACLAPAISFGAIFDKETDGMLGTVEMIMSSAISGIAYSILAGQPLCILGATGPELAYTVVFYSMCKSLDIEFLPARVWEALWTALFTLICAVFDLSFLMRYFTRFTEEIFSFLISAIFIVSALTNCFKAFSERSREAAYLTMILCFGTYIIAVLVKKFAATTMTNPKIRKIAGNFAVTIGIAIATFVAWCWKEVDIEYLNVPETFEPTYLDPVTNAKRAWVINPFGTHKTLPIWVIFFTAGPAAGLTILGYLDQNLTAMLINRKDNKLKKPAAYHLDLIVCALFVYPICGILGLPFTHAATVRSLTHLISLTEYKNVKLPGTHFEVKKPVKVIEQRVSNFGIHFLIGASLAATTAMKLLPISVLLGVFLYMGISSLAGNQMWERFLLYTIWDTSKHPPYPFLKGLPISRVHYFTAFQCLMFAILYALASIKAVAVCFPFFIALLGPIRSFILGKMFSVEELAKLDAAGDDDDGDRAADDKDESKKDLTTAAEAQDDAFRNDNSAGQTRVDSERNGDKYKVDV